MSVEIKRIEGGEIKKYESPEGVLVESPAGSLLAEAWHGNSGLIATNGDTRVSWRYFGCDPEIEIIIKGTRITITPNRTNHRKPKLTLDWEVQTIVREE